MKTFETVSFHIVKPCNMSCKFCYATFEDFTVQKQLTPLEIRLILSKLRLNGVEKITFAGGEPMLYKQLEDVIIDAKHLGFTTSIITNGTFMTPEFLERMTPYLDWIGLSIDSLNEITNEKIGRKTKLRSPDKEIYDKLIYYIKKYNYKLKINTVVNIHNQEELLFDFVQQSGASRWKVFDTLRVEGQNNKQFEEIRSTKFEQFVKNNQHPAMVVESNELMTGSYLLIDPLGRLFENSQGKHTYSRSLINHSFKECISDISLDREMFIKRGGIYKW